MGLMLRGYLFYSVGASDVCGALKEWYAAHGIPLDTTGPVYESIGVHEPDNNWVVAELATPGWYWQERRKVGAFISERLWCPGFLVFVYDGEYWGYEFYDRGEALD